MRLRYENVIINETDEGRIKELKAQGFKEEVPKKKATTKTQKKAE